MATAASNHAGLYFEGERSPALSVSVLARMLSGLARLAQRRSSLHTKDDLARTTEEANYRRWRRSELERQLVDHFDVDAIRGRTVLDFGCGTGELSRILLEKGAAKVVGIDKDGQAIRRAGDTIDLPDEMNRSATRFVLSERDEVIPLGDDSVDLICCFDALEHLPNVAAIAGEWMRVLKPGGRVWIWWSPWRGPYGHHLESLLPLPWIHLCIPERRLFEACSLRYDASDFVPRKWDIDPGTGLKKTNKWLRTHTFHPFLNKLTRSAWERILARTHLSIVAQQTHGFNGSWLRRATRTLLPIPLLGDCFVSFYIYELTN